MTARTFSQPLPSLAQMFGFGGNQSLQPQGTAVRDLQGHVRKIKNCQVGFKQYQVTFTWQSFDDIYQAQPELFPWLNTSKNPYKLMACIARHLAASDRIHVSPEHSAESRFYIPLKIVSGFVWYAEARATAGGWQVDMREPISRQAPCPYALLRVR